MKVFKYLVVMLFAASCSCAQQKEERILPEFRGLGVNGSFTVTLIKSNTPKVLIESSAPLEKIVTEVEDGVLKIKPKGRERVQGNITVYYTVIDKISSSGSSEIKGKDLIEVENFRISLNGSGDINLENLKVKNCDASIAGSGDIKLGGQVEGAQYSIAGSGDIHAYGLEAVRTFISIAGSGDAEVNVSGNMNISIAGSGDVKYKGNPKIDKVSIAGSGSLEKQ